MNIVAIATARNEQDVIEAFVRHTSAICSCLVIIDHGSTDATPAILKELQAEGLPLRVIRDETVGLLQTRHMNRLLQMAVNELQADWVLCLDADEFVQGDLRAALADHAARSPEEYVKYPLKNYFVRESDDPQELNPVKRMVNRFGDQEETERIARHYKSIIPREMALRKEAFLEGGNHSFLIGGVEPASEYRADIWIAHFSLRQPAQYAGKVVANLFQKKLLRVEGTGAADYYAADLRKIRESYTAYAEDFCNVPIPWWGARSTEVVCEPIDYRGGELRHTPRVDDVDLFIRNTIDAGEHVTRTLAGQSGAAPSGDDQESREIVFALKAGGAGGKVHEQTFQSGMSGFTGLRFPLEAEASPSTRLDFEMRGGRGMLEIEWIELHFSKGEVREITPNECRKLFSCSKGGILASGGAVVQVFADFAPVTLTLRGVLGVQGMGEQPEAVVLRVRFVRDYRMLGLALCDGATIERFRREMKAGGEEALPPLSCPFDQEMVFRPTGNGGSMIREGWKVAYSGLWLNAKQGRLVFRLPAPTTSAFQLKFELRCKMPSAKVSEGARVRIFIDGQELATHPLGERYQKQLEIKIPAEPRGRREIDVAFSLETTDPGGRVGFAIKKARLLPLGRRERFFLRCRRWMDQLAGALEPRKQNAVALGEEISFAQGGRGVWIATSGWGSSGSWGTPVEGGASILKFRVKGGAGDLRVRLELRSPYPQSTGLPLKLAMGELDVASWTVQETAPLWLEAPLPAKALSLSKKGEITLMLKASCLQGELELSRMIVERASS